MSGKSNAEATYTKVRRHGPMTLCQEPAHDTARDYQPSRDNVSVREAGQGSRILSACSWNWKYTRSGSRNHIQWFQRCRDPPNQSGTAVSPFIISNYPFHYSVSLISLLISDSHVYSRSSIKRAPEPVVLQFITPPSCPQSAVPRCWCAQVQKQRFVDYNIIVVGSITKEVDCWLPSALSH